MSLLAGLLVAPEAQAVYAIAQYGEPKYPADFKHFDYVNPDAPKGGTLVLANPSRLTSFDKFNPFTLRGNPAPGVDLMFESLTIGSSDEVASAYGLLADDIKIAPDGLSTTFHINPRARFSNGDPVTADDVKFSLDTLKSPQAAPQFASIFGEITRAVGCRSSTRSASSFSKRNRELPLIAGSMPVFSRKWGMKPDGSRIAVRPVRVREADRKRPLSDRSATRTAARSRIAAIRTTGGRRLPVRRRHEQFRSHRLQAVFG